MTLKFIEGFDQYAGQSGAALLSSLSANGFAVTAGLAIAAGRKLGGSALELQVAAGAAGSSWSSRTNNVRQALRGVAANSAGRFVAVGDAGSAVYSDDNINWLPLILGTASNMRAIKNHASTWITVGDNSSVLRSTDGRNFVPITIPLATANLRAVAWGNGVWVIAGVNGAAGVLFVSVDDGLTWTQSALATPTTVPSFNDVAYGDVWMAVGTAGAVYTSVDAITWVKHSMGASLVIASAVFGTFGRWLAIVGADIWRSSDAGTTWTLAAAAIAGAGGTLTSLAQADARWIAVAVNGQVRVSDDELTWDAATLVGAGNTPLYCVAAARGSRVGYVTVGALNIAVSPASARRALIYISLAPPTTVLHTFVSTENRLVIGFCHRSTARGRILSITDILDMDWSAGISINGGVGIAIPARNVDYYYELVLDRAALTVTLYINNVLDQVAPLPPEMTAKTAFDVIWMAENGAVSRIDDIYTLDSSSPNLETLVDRLGPITIPLRLPDADAGPNDWTTANNGAHWTEVGLLPPSNESFIRSAVSGAQDFFTSSTEVPAGPIIAVGVIALAQKGDIDNRQLGLGVGTGGDRKEIIDPVMSVVPEYSIAIFETGPGDVAWDASNIVSTPFGVIVRP